MKISVVVASSLVTRLMGFLQLPWVRVLCVPQSGDVLDCTPRDRPVVPTGSARSG
jgi:hypothetical protein